jgi:hypothetical protein
MKFTHSKVHPPSSHSDHLVIGCPVAVLKKAPRPVKPLCPNVRTLKIPDGLYLPADAHPGEVLVDGLDFLGRETLGHVILPASVSTGE